MVQATAPASKDVSISGTLLAPLNELQALAHTLFLSLAPPQTKPPPPPPLSAFLECDRALAEAINLVHVHQIKQRKIDALEAEILQLESQWRDICTQLENGKAELQEIIEEGDERITAIEEARRGELSLESLRAACHSFVQRQYHTPNFSPMRRVSAPLLRRHPICLT